MALDDNPARALRRTARRGCLGCLSQVGVALALGLVLVIVLTGLLFPWAFYLGGRFHIIPMWRGWGRAHAKSGDYLVYIQIEPSTASSRMYPSNSLKGIAYVCTPRGERLTMKLGGGMRKGLKLSTDGEAIRIYMNYWPLGYGGFITDRRPYLDFRGHWKNPDMVMDDHGSISNAFQSDGTVYRGHDSNRPYSTEIVPITFVEGSKSEFDQACSAIHINAGTAH